MLKISHLVVADRTYKTIQSNLDWKLNKLAFKLGSIAPDINCVYPLHTVEGTFKRFRKRLEFIDNSDSTIKKSFLLGVITHYICDYFCYAHNLGRTDPMHAVYERILRGFIRKHIDNHEKLLKELDNSISEQWEEIKLHVASEINKNGESKNSNSLTGLTGKNDIDIDTLITNISINGKDHIDYIMETLTCMHDNYIKQTTKLNTKDWYMSIEKMKLDLEYSTFLCKRMIYLILKPDMELVIVE